MNQNINSRLLRRLACLSFMVASMFFNVSYGMKRAGNFDDDRGDNKHPKNEKQYPLRQQMIDLEHDEASVINCSCISPDGELLAVGYEDGLVKILDADNGLLISMLYSRRKGPVSMVKWSPDGNYVLALIEPSDSDDEDSSDSENGLDNEMYLGEIDLWNEIGSNNEINLENENSITNENDSDDSDDSDDLDDAIYLGNYSNDCPLVVLWKKDNNRTFRKNHESCHAMDMKDITIIDFAFTNDAKLVLFTSDGIDVIYYDPNNDFQVLNTHGSKKFDENNGLWGKEICTYGDGEYCLCGFDGFYKENGEPKVTLKLFHHLNGLLNFEFDGKLIDCALSHHNHILVLTSKKEPGSKTTAVCYSFIHTSTETSSKELFTLEHDNYTLEKLYYSSECAFIIGYANQQDAPAVVFVWDCSGKLLRKITIDDTHVDGQIKLYVAKIVDTILTLIFSDDERSWSASFNLANIHQNIMKREYGAKPSTQDIHFQSLQLSIDQDGELSIKTNGKK